MRALVTGAAGFIGETLVRQLLAESWEVVGLDTRAHQDRFDVPLAPAGGSGRYRFVHDDVLTVDLSSVLDGADVVFHLAGQPGVRTSWATKFELHLRNNVHSTQRLLDAIRDRPLSRLVHASSSSIYGEAPPAGSAEDDPKSPHSPYGVSKLAAELLCTAYAANFGTPTVSLRYFTVYGPRQRPDMSIDRMVRAARRGTTFEVFGDGTQVRDFTFVTDIVRATVAAATAPVPSGTAINVASGSPTTLQAVIDCVEDITGMPIRVEHSAVQPGDVNRTAANIDRANHLLGWRPAIGLHDGLTAQVKWHLDHADDAANKC